MDYGNQTMELTIRQKAFLAKLIDLYQEMQEPLHYSVIADKLGLSKSATYDMLRLLEKRGMATSEYGIPKKIHGPGRSNVLFVPTAKSRALFSHLSGDSDQDEEWDQVKSRILNRLIEGKASDYGDLIRELLDMVPNTHSPIACCGEITTVLLLSLKEGKYNFGPRNPLNSLLAMSCSKVGMSILTGTATGLMYADKVSRKFFSKFERYTERYENALEQLTPKAIEDLHRFTENIMGILATRKP